MNERAPRTRRTVRVQCGSCGEYRSVRYDNAARPGKNRCRVCASRETKKPFEEAVIQITPDIATWALITSAFFNESDWRLIRELPPYVAEAA